MLPATSTIGNTQERVLLPTTVAELTRLGVGPWEVALDAGFAPGRNNNPIEHLASDRAFIAGRQEPGSKRTGRRLARYRTCKEGPISRLKRRYGMNRSHVKGDEASSLD